MTARYYPEPPTDFRLFTIPYVKDGVTHEIVFRPGVIAVVLGVMITSGILALYDIDYSTLPYLVIHLSLVLFFWGLLMYNTEIDGESVLSLLHGKERDVLK